MPSEAAAVALVADGVGVKLNEDASLKVWRHAELNRSAQAVGEEGVAASGAPRPWPEWRPSADSVLGRSLTDAQQIPTSRQQGRTFPPSPADRPGGSRPGLDPRIQDVVLLAPNFTTNPYDPL